MQDKEQKTDNPAVHESVQDTPPPTVRRNVPRPYTALLSGRKKIGVWAGVAAALGMGLLDAKNVASGAFTAPGSSTPQVSPQKFEHKRMSGAVRHRRALRASRKKMQKASRKINRGTRGGTKRRGQQ